MFPFDKLILLTCTLFSLVNCKQNNVVYPKDKSILELCENRYSAKIGGEYELIKAYILRSENGIKSELNKSEVLLRNDSLGFEIQSEIYPNTGEHTIEVVTKPFEFNEKGISQFVETTRVVSEIFKRLRKYENSSEYFSISQLSDYGDVLIKNAMIKVNRGNYTFDQFTFPMTSVGIINLYESQGIFNQYTQKYVTKYQQVFRENKKIVRNLLGEEIDIYDQDFQAFIYLVHNFMDRYKTYGSHNTVKNGLPWLKSRTSFVKLFQLLSPEIQKALAYSDGKPFIRLMAFMLSDEILSPEDMSKSLFEQRIYKGILEKEREVHVKHLRKDVWLKAMTQGINLLDVKEHCVYYTLENRREITEDLIGFFDFKNRTAFFDGKEVGVFELRRGPRILDYDEFPSYASKIANFMYDLNFRSNLEFYYDSEFVF